jgi:hypothetical protein
VRRTLAFTEREHDDRPPGVRPDAAGYPVRPDINQEV